MFEGGNSCRRRLPTATSPNVGGLFLPVSPALIKVHSDCDGCGKSCIGPGFWHTGLNGLSQFTSHMIVAGIAVVMVVVLMVARRWH